MYILEGTAVVTDMTKSTPLATLGQVVDGVSADGVAQIVLRIKANSAGQQLTLKVINDQGNLSPSVDEDGGLMPIGGNTPQSNITVTAVDTNPGPMAFAIYRAPVDFPRQSGVDENASLRRVSVHVRSDTGFSRNGSIKIVRPPVALIHGVWGKPDTWEFFTPLTEGKNGASTDDPRFRIRRIDYATTSAAGFEENAIITLKKLRKFIEEFNKKFHVASVQADVVAHSMGGNIARTWVTLRDRIRMAPTLPFSNDANYNHGEVHKLITIDTPYLGSPLANLLLNSDPLCRFILGTYGKPVENAVRDLATGSAALQALRGIDFVLKAHVLLGIADHDTQEVPTENRAVQIGLTGILGVCPDLLPSGGFQEVFQNEGGLSDLIVSAHSQFATGLAISGFSPPASRPFQGGIIHAVDTKLFIYGPDVLGRDVINANGRRILGPASTGISDEVIFLLNTSVGNTDFFNRIQP